MAVVADIPEVVGFAIALRTLAGIPIIYGIVVAAAATMIGLSVMSWGVRPLEALVSTLVAFLVGGCIAQNLAVVPAEQVSSLSYLVEEIIKNYFSPRGLTRVPMQWIL